MKKIYVLSALLLLTLLVNAQIYNNAFKIESSSVDRGMRICTDNTGNVITTGYFSGSADFDPSPATFSLTPIGMSTRDIYLAKYDASLNFIWAVKFGTSGADNVYALATDTQGNIVVGGDVSTSSGDGFLNKYDAGGNLLWSVVIGGINKDVVYGVATDGSNGIYMTGYFENTVDFDPGSGSFPLTSNGGRDVFLAKYDPAGNLVWAFNVGGTISTAYEEGGQDLVVNGSSVFLTGNFEGTADFDPDTANAVLTSNGSLDIFLAKYDTSGNHIWSFNVGSANKHDYSYGIDLDGASNIYITGGFEESVDFDPSAGSYVLTSASALAQDIFLAKYDSSGSFLWTLSAGGNTGVDDHAFDIDVTLSGDVFITGEVWGPADFDPSAGVANINPSNDQIFFARYDASGNFVWVFDVGATSSNGSADNGFGVHENGNGTLYVTGDFSGTADFDPGVGTASLAVPNQGHVFIASYNTTSVTGIPGNLADSWRIFPNPAAETVKFIPGENAEKWTLKISDITGKLHYLKEDINSKHLTLSVDCFPKGIYLAEISTEKSHFVTRLVVN